MRDHIIRLDSELGTKLGLIKANFDDAFLWDCRPSYLGVIRLTPKNKEALEIFFNLGKNIYSTIRICAPTQDIIDMSKEYGYELKIDPAGLPYLTDETLKIASRQRLQELTSRVKK